MVSSTSPTRARTRSASRERSLSHPPFLFLLPNRFPVIPRVLYIPLLPTQHVPPFKHHPPSLMKRTAGSCWCAGAARLLAGEGQQQQQGKTEHQIYSKTQATRPPQRRRCRRERKRGEEGVRWVVDGRRAREKREEGGVSRWCSEAWALNMVVRWCGVLRGTAMGGKEEKSESEDRTRRVSPRLSA